MCRPMNERPPLEYKLSSPAKLNLGLWITGRLATGYHEIQSLFWPIDFADQLTIRESDEPSTVCRWVGNELLPIALPSQEQNLVHRSLRNFGVNWTVEIEKRIPIGGGLGGGSSNAGTVMREMIRRELTTEERAEAFCPTLGADVPFFLRPVPSWVTGIGEHRSVIQLREHLDIGFLLVLIPEACETKEVFGWFKESGEMPRGAKLPLDSSQPLDNASLQRYLAQCENMLESPVVRHRPRIREVLRRLREALPDALYIGLSGSGSTCFAVLNGVAGLSRHAQVLEPTFRKLECGIVCARSA